MSGIVHWLNVSVTRYNDRKWVKKTYRSLSSELEDVFSKGGDGLWSITLVSKNNNIIARFIGMITKLFVGVREAYSHFSFFMVGDEWKAWLSQTDFNILKDKLGKYYLNRPSLKDVRAMIMASADENGMNYFSVSNYQTRKFILRKIPVNDPYILQCVVKDLLALYNTPYDVTGLLMWPLYRLFKFFKFFDDARAMFCSEQVKVLYKYGIRMADIERPSPADIEKFLGNMWVRYIKTTQE
jgi:hypothetical protein